MSPGETLNCWPPARITAYIKPPSPAYGCGIKARSNILLWTILMRLLVPRWVSRNGFPQPAQTRAPGKGDEGQSNHSILTCAADFGQERGPSCRFYDFRKVTVQLLSS